MAASRHAFYGMGAGAQCEPEACAEMEARYGRKEHVDERAAFRHRHLMIVEGNTFSSRRARKARPLRTKRAHGWSSVLARSAAHTDLSELCQARLTITASRGMPISWACGTGPGMPARRHGSRMQPSKRGQGPLCVKGALQACAPSMTGQRARGRLLWTLASGSLVFRSHLFTEWYDDRIRPFVHYLPVRAPAPGSARRACAWACRLGDVRACSKGTACPLLRVTQRASHALWPPGRLLAASHAPIIPIRRARTCSAAAVWR